MPERTKFGLDLQRELDTVLRVPLQQALDDVGLGSQGTMVVDSHNYRVRFRRNPETSSSFMFLGEILRSTDLSYAAVAGPGPVASILELRTANDQQAAALLAIWGKACGELGIQNLVASNVPQHQRKVWFDAGYDRAIPSRSRQITGATFLKKLP